MDAHRSQGDGRVEHWVNAVLVAWVHRVRAHARAVLAGTAVATLAVAAYTATHLGITTHHTALLSEDLEFWKDYNEFAEVFPILDEALLVVVEAETPEQARDATRALAGRFAAEPELFESVYAPGADDFFERNALLYLSVEDLEDLTDHLASVQPILAELAEDRSLANLAEVLQDGLEYAREEAGSQIQLAAVFDSLSRAVAAVLEGRPRPVSWTELLLQRSLPGDTSRRLIVLQPVLDYDRLLPARRAMSRVRAIAKGLGLGEGRSVRVRITGNVALNTEEMVTVARQAAGAAVGSFVLVGCVLTLALRSRRMVLSILTTLLVGLVWTAGFASLAVGQLNIISIAFAVLFIGLGVDFGIHLAMRHAELVRGGEELADALEETSRSVGGSLVLCAFTTAIGFYVFVPTDYRAVAELGLISGTGMLISLFASLTVLPALFATGARADVGREWGGAQGFARALIAISSRHPRRVCAAALALGLGCALLVPYARFDHNVVEMRDPSTESAQTFDELLSESDTSPWTIDVLQPDLTSAERVAERLVALPVVERAVTLRDYVPERQEEKAQILVDLSFFLPEPPFAATTDPSPELSDQIAALAALKRSLEQPWIAAGDARRAASAERAARYLERLLDRLETLERKRTAVETLETFEESLTGALPAQMTRLWRALDPERVTLESLPEDLRGRMLADDGRARVQVLPSEDLSDNASIERFVDHVLAEVPEATGSAVTLLEWSRAVVRSFQQALGSAVLVVALLLWLLWGRIGDMLLVLTPLVLASLLTVASSVLLDIPFNFANVVVLPLLLGIGVDSGIHLVHRHRENLERGAAAPEVALLGTSTAQAVFFSALTTMGSFGSLVLSSHVGFASLGQLLLVGVTATLVCNLVFLPALIALRRPAEGVLLESDPTAA